jgi:glycosyltransferase involved in cell wall biosynthesis
MTRAPAQKRLLLLGDARQVHLARWADYIASIGYEVLTVSLEPNERVPDPKHRIHLPRFLPPFVRYPLAVPATRRLIRDFAPDVVNAHFLPNYGVIASMTGFSPWVLSAWGSDIMLLPQKSVFHMRRTRRVIRSAAFITSDAKVMSERLVELGAAPGRVVTFPYGVDRELFHPAAEDSGVQGPRIISNRKLEAVYDIPTVLAAFQGLKRSLEMASLTVAGDGSLAAPLREQAVAVPRVDSLHGRHVARRDARSVAKT